MKARSTRRSFIRQTGAALSVPLAAAAATAPASAAPDDPAVSRLERLEDLEAIRVLNQTFARLVNDGNAGYLGVDASIRGIAMHEFGWRDAIEFAPDGTSARSRMHCTVDFETPITPSCPLVEMALEQGGGVVRRSEIGVFELACVKSAATWSITGSTYRQS